MENKFSEENFREEKQPAAMENEIAVAGCALLHKGLLNKGLLEMEEGFGKAMREIAEPYLKAHEQKGSFRSFDGRRIAYRMYRCQDSKANVMIIHGFSEFSQKYNEVIYTLLLNHYSAYIIDLRGHGESEREVDNPYIVDVKDFGDYIKDLHLFYWHKVRTNPGKNILFGHSMGGGIAVRYLEEYPKDFDRAVLSSPMIKMRTGKFPFLAAQEIAHLEIKRGHGADFVLGQGDFDPEDHLERSSSRSPERYAYNMDLRRSDIHNQIWSADYYWMYASCRNTAYIEDEKKIRRVKLPVLLFYAGGDHLVYPEKIRWLTEKIHGCRSYYFPDAKHEIYNGSEQERLEFYRELLNFFEE